MTSYNENLYATVVASLQAIGQEQLQVKSQVNATMFSLYHAQGAAITANGLLEASNAQCTFQQAVKAQAVHDNNIAVNALASATEAGTCMQQAVGNTSVCAANVQVASNAILRLAGDVGNIFSIVNAADYGTDIFNQAGMVRELINDTAYAAEQASQMAMDATMAVSEISGGTVLDTAKATAASMANLLTIASTGLDAANQTSVTNNANLATTLAAEKIQEGSLEDVEMDYKAVKAAYQATNQELNLDLQVLDVTNAGFSVRFDRVKSPFSSDTENGKPFYPVDSYYLVVVKENKQTVFTLSNAENLFMTSPERLIPVKMAVTTGPETPGAETTEIASASGSTSAAPTSTLGPTSAAPTGGSTAQTGASQQSVSAPATLTQAVQIMQFSTKHVSGTHLKDSDGDMIKLGENYVVFVFAIYLDEYKRKLNDFSDFLSAPSKRFCLQNQLKTVDSGQFFIYQVKGKTQELIAGTEPEDTQIKNAISKWKNMPSTPYVLFFVAGDKASFKPQYRCMLLPDYTANYLLTKASFHYLIDAEIEKAEAIASKYDPQIQSLQSQLIQLSGDQEQTSRELDSIQGQLTASVTADSATMLTALQHQVTQVQDKTSQLATTVKTTQDQLDTAIQEKNTALDALHPDKGGKPGFFFNTTIAGQVSAGNYTPAVVVLTLENGQSLYAMGFGTETTDNFGNQLTSGSVYIPAVYSASGVEEANHSQFKPALSDVASTANFTYSE